MKAKYLIQISVNNAALGVGGFATIDGAMTRAVAEEKAAAIRAAELFARPESARQIRVITPAKRRAENRAAFEGARA
jgi:hypothetical protein